MKDIHIPHRDKAELTGQLKGIWLAPSAVWAKERAAALGEKYVAQYPKALETPAEGLEDSLFFYAFPKLDSRKTASINRLERLNEEIRRQTRVVGIFPNPNAYLSLVTTFLMEYADDWSVFRAYLSEEFVHCCPKQPISWAEHLEIANSPGQYPNSKHLPSLAAVQLDEYSCSCGKKS